MLVAGLWLPRVILYRGNRNSLCHPPTDKFIFRGTYSCIKPWYSPHSLEALLFSQHSSFPIYLVVRGKKRQLYAALPCIQVCCLGGSCAPGACVLMSFGVSCQSSVHAVTKTFQPSQHNKQWCFSWKYLSFFPAWEIWMTYDFVPKFIRNNS